MADGDDRQATFGSDGSLETDRTPDATGENDFGEEKDANETDGGYSRYVVSSLLQKAVRRSDEEAAAWAAWELARSGYAALAAARARSTREASNADAYFSAVAEVRAEARERGEEPAHDYPVGDLDPEGEYEAVFDGHTGEGSKRGRGTRFFKTHGARVGPEGEDEQSARWQRLAMILDEDIEYDAAELDRAVEPVDPDDPWESVESGDDETRTKEADPDGPDGRDADEGGEGGRDDDTGSLSDFAE